MKNFLRGLGKNSFAIFYGFFTAHLGIEILSATFFAGMMILIVSVELRDYLNGVGAFNN